MLDVLVFLLVLGVLVFVHELGHFVAAKACGVYCDRFSLGMPPRVWGFKWGETDYCIGALPIGGYVKMAGQEDAPRTPEEREKEYAHVPPERFYNNKPVWQRSIIIFAGPFMNLVLGVLLYGIVAYVGAEVPETKVDNRVGGITPGSPAQDAPMYLVHEGRDPDEVAIDGKPDAVGWRTGDRIVSIDGQRIGSVVQDVRIDAVLGAGSVRRVLIERTVDDGQRRQEVRYVSPVAPKLMEGQEHPEFGVTPYRTALVGELLPGMPAEKAGLKKGDIILRSNGEPVDSGTFSEMVEGMTEEKPIDLAVKRGQETVHVTVTPTVTGRIAGAIFSPGPLSDKPEDDTHPVVVDVNEKMEEQGLKRKDILLSIDGQPATASLLRTVERERPDQDVPVVVKRPAIFYGLLRREQTIDLKLPVKKVGAIGVVFQPKTVFHREAPAQVVPEAFRQGYLALARTVETVKKLVTGDQYVRAKDLGGPVMIYDIMADARRLGWNWLLEMTAFISINLCVFNLLPLPVLDGGQLVFLGLEAVRRRPIDMRVLERVQQMGIVFIVILILFVTFNDFQRLFQNIIP